jgi:tRNA uridine 5-carboxymethylaminomethyl modification enzyme
LISGEQVPCRAAVLTTGTFLRGLIHVGLTSTPGGREGEPAAMALSAFLSSLGLRLGRLKTGTPCRLHRDSIDLAQLQEQPGDHPPPRLSFWSQWDQGLPPLPQVSCHITYTNPATHDIIRSSLDRSPLYAGRIQGTGPRYCPSIEDKVVRFADRDRHQVFIEPEGLESQEVYPNGISTSLPEDVQQRLVHSIAGLEQARILRPGYAVEYDFVDPLQLMPSLQLRDLEGLYLAGQINGTSGYEEAAAQGLLAGINAALQVRGSEPLILRRDQAYTGVLVDDLVTRGTTEPYRMFTSRAEYRLLLREDNADSRLTPLGRELGLIDDSRWQVFCRRQQHRNQLREHLETTRVPSAHLDLTRLLEQAGTTAARPGTALCALLRRPEVTLDLLQRAGLIPHHLVGDPLCVDQAELNIKYEGYIRRQVDKAHKLARLENLRLPPSLDYDQIPGLSNEAREKLSNLRPLSLGQASRIAGVTPAAIAILEIHLHAQQAQTNTEGVSS